MSVRTRYFVIASLLTIGVGLGAGLVAYSFGLPTSARTRQGGPDELRLLPANAGIVAYADVHEIMTSELRQRLRSHSNAPQDFQTQTGIDIDNDIDHVTVAVVPGAEADASRPAATIVLARGRFDQVKIEQLMRSHGGQVEEYRGTRLVNSQRNDGAPAMSVAFVEPGLIAIGSAALVHGAVDLKAGGSSIATNDQIMALVRDLDTGNAWAVGRFDALTSQGGFAAGVADQIPSVSFFSASARIDSGIRGTLRAEARDEAAANSLRDVVRGIVALARVQASGRPDLASALQSLQLAGTGKTVSLSFDLPATALDGLGAMLPHRSAGTANR